MRSKETRRQVFGFVISGACATLIDASILQSLVTFLDFSPYLARAFSFTTAVIFTWQFNRRFSFKVDKPSTFKEFIQYLSSQSVGQTVNIGVYLLVVWSVDIAKIYPALALIPATIVSMFLNFAAMKFFVFKEKTQRY